MSIVLSVLRLQCGRDAYTLHKPRRIRFPRRKTYSKGIADLYQIDLADMSNISSYNDGVRYLLTCIARKRGRYPLERRPVAKSRTLSRRNGTPNMVQSDKRTEFLNSTCQSMLKRRGIKFYTDRKSVV